MSENRSLAVLEVLVHLAASLPDRYVLGSAEISREVSVEVIPDNTLPADWATLDPAAQFVTKQIGDGWISQQRSAILSVPSVVSGERNYVLNPAHPEFQQIVFPDPVPFRFDVRLLSARVSRVV